MINIIFIIKFIIVFIIATIINTIMTNTIIKMINIIKKGKQVEQAEQKPIRFDFYSKEKNPYYNHIQLKGIRELEKIFMEMKLPDDLNYTHEDICDDFENCVNLDKTVEHIGKIYDQIANNEIAYDYFYVFLFNSVRYEYKCGKTEYNNFMKKSTHDLSDYVRLVEYYEDFYDSVMQQSNQENLFCIREDIEDEYVIWTSGNPYDPIYISNYLNIFQGYDKICENSITGYDKWRGYSYEEQINEHYDLCIEIDECHSRYDWNNRKKMSDDQIARVKEMKEYDHELIQNIKAELGEYLHIYKYFRGQ